MKYNLKKVIFHKFNKFLIGGLIGYPLKIIVTFILTDLLGVWYFVSYLIALGIIFAFNFFYNTYITFEVGSNKKENFVKYCITLGIFVAIDAIAVKILTEILRIHYLISITLITIGIVILKFVAYKKFVFTSKNKKYL